MKVTCLLGSPRPKGNSAAIAARFRETAERAGADVHVYSLNKLKYRGCQACMTCKTKLDKCVLKDDLAEVLDAIRESHILVLATPTYYGDISSQLKAFIDRTFSYLKPDYTTNPNPSRIPPGKKLVFIQTQADPDEGQYGDIFPRYEAFFKWYGFDAGILIRSCGVSEIGEVEKRQDVMKLAENTAESLLQ